MPDYSVAKGLVARAIAAAGAYADSTEQKIRIGKYGDQYAIPLMRKQHSTAEAGAYFTCNNGQSGIASTTGTSFSATVGLFNIYNTASTGGKRIYLDYLKLVTTAAGSFASGGVNLQAVCTIDTGDRYLSGGTVLTGNKVNVNMDDSTASVAAIRFGALTLTAASGSVRTIVGLDILRPVVSATVADVIGEVKLVNFGGVEAMLNGSITVANANHIPKSWPPIILGPNQSCNVHFIMNGTTPGAASYAPEVGWWEY